MMDEGKINEGDRKEAEIHEGVGKATASRSDDVTMGEAAAEEDKAASLAGFIEHKRRIELAESDLRTTRSRLQDVEEMLLSQIAYLETQNQKAVAAVESRLMQSLHALTARVEASESARLTAEQRTREAEAHALKIGTQQDVYKQMWLSAPLTLRLKFMRDLLPEDHALQNVLKEAMALEELRRRGRDLETWVTNYPALFAEAAQALISGAEGNAAAPDNSVDSETHPVYTLTTQTLQEAQTTLETTLQALGLTWIAPAPGDPILAEHEVIGEERSPQSEGRVARSRRRGFRIQGRLALPAQVFRAAPAVPAAIAAAPIVAVPAAAGPVTAVPADAAVLTEQAQATNCVANTNLTGELKEFVRGLGLSPTAPSVVSPMEKMSVSETGVSEAGVKQENTSRGAGEGTGAPARTNVLEREAAPGLSDLPDWMRMLGQRTFGCEHPVVTSLAEQVSALSGLPARLRDETTEEAAGKLLTDALQPLLPLLGLRYADGLPGVPEAWGGVFLEVRDPLLAWLSERLGVTVVAPMRGEAFDPRTMEVTESRRTVHAHENETVAKLERVGIIWRSHPLIHAQVVRYAVGGTM